jgi:hypothetical protein
MQSTLDDPTVVTSEKRASFHIAEFTALRSEMVEEFKMVPANFRYAATLSGVIAAWLLSWDRNVSGYAASVALKAAYWLPLLLTCLLGGLTQAYHLRTHHKQTYLRRVEDALGFHDLGWEKQKSKEAPHFKEAAMYLPLWVILGVADLLLIIVSLFGLSS